QPAIVGKAAEELHLFLRDRFPAGEGGKMGEADVDENSVVRSGDLLKRIHLSGDGDADFENGQRRRLLRRQYSKRQTQLSVVAARLGEQYAARKQSFEGVLDDGLAVASGDRQHTLKMLAAMPASQGLQSAQGVGNYDDWPFRRQVQACDMVLCDQCRRGAVAKCVREEAMAVSLGSLEGDEERCRSSAARIGADGIGGGGRGRAARSASNLMG